MGLAKVIYRRAQRLRQIEHLFSCNPSMVLAVLAVQGEIPRKKMADLKHTKNRSNHRDTRALRSSIQEVCQEIEHFFPGERVQQTLGHRRQA